jgi:ribosomal-protein-alanine N-acetyltransferase
MMLFWWWPWLWLYERPRAVVRRVRLEDAAELAQLHAASFDRGWSRLDFERLCIDPSVLGHVVQLGSVERPVGFVLSRLAADEAEILSIAISPAIRRQGLAGTLLGTHAEALVHEGVLTLFLEVEDGNHPAMGLYRRHGFAEVGRRAAYYAKADGSRAEALIMRKSL